MKQLIAKHQHLWTDEQIYSLAQGVVYWKPPETVNEAILKAMNEADSALHSYAPDEGLPELIAAIQQKLSRENDLSSEDVKVIVTSGANQAYMNCVLTLLDEGDLSIVFKPYYFNHVMAIQMTRGDDALLVGPVDDDGFPSIPWLKEQFESEKGEAIKMITVTNPGNPTGVSIPKAKLQEIVDLCREHGKWVIFDCTYEQFDHSRANVYSINNDNASRTDGFHCFSDEHVMSIFSFSKGYAMAGFRVGYVVVNTCSEVGKNAYEQMVKVQDTIPICTSRISQVRCIDAICIMHHACFIDLLLRVEKKQTFHFLFSISLTACRTWCTKGRKIMG
jgi:aspartate/methionine/tyrosine aminotransferase